MHTELINCALGKLIKDLLFLRILLATSKIKIRARDYFLSK